MTLLRERASVTDAISITDAASGQIEVTIITPGQGSSGFYGDEVLESAARKRVFPAGTLMFLDHASETEAYDRPERSVKDVGAVLSEDARWDGSGLKANARLVGPWAGALREMSASIGVSICAQGELKEGQIVSLDPSFDNSVDFVTYPGRGGSFQVMENRRPSRVNARAVRHGIAEATVNDTREALQNALTERFGADRTYVWVRDFDDTTVWYEVDAPNESATYALGYSATDDAEVTLVDSDPQEVKVHTEYVPVSPAGGSTTESQEGTMPQIEESRLAQLETDAGRAQEADRRADEAERRATVAETRNASLEAREAARPIATRVMAESTTLPASTRARVAEQMLAQVRVKADEKLDEAAFETACKSAREQAETELAEALAEAGVGQPRNFGTGGQSVEDESEQGTFEASESARASLFGRKIEKGA